jgi:hypothetical protein
MSELIELQATLQTLKARKAILVAMGEVINGALPVGSQPEVIARALRTLTPIPLKYTQSSLGLQSLYKWAVENHDTEIIQWTANQIEQVLGAKTLAKYREDFHASGGSTRLDTTPRQAFIEAYRTITPNSLNRLIGRTDASTFWGKQLHRFGGVNQKRCQLFPSTTYEELKQMHPFYETLKIVVRSDPKDSRAGAMRSLVGEHSVSPYVVLPALVEVLAPRKDWAGIYDNENLRKSFPFKKLLVPVSVVLQLLQECGAPEAVQRELQQKYG